MKGRELREIVKKIQFEKLLTQDEVVKKAGLGSRSNFNTLISKGKQNDDVPLFTLKKLATAFPEYFKSDEESEPANLVKDDGEDGYKRVRYGQHIVAIKPPHEMTDADWHQRELVLKELELADKGQQEKTLLMRRAELAAIVTEHIGRIKELDKMLADIRAAGKKSES